MFRKDMKRTMGILVAFMVAISLMVACSGTKLKTKPIATSENPTEQINLLGNAIALARKDQVHVLAPTWFARAESSLYDAKKGLENGEELSKIFNSISRGRIQLKEAEKFAKVAKVTLPEVIKGRDLARTAGATSLGKDYTDAETSFLELTEAIEKNDLNFARQNQPKVNQLFRLLELRAIKIQTIGEVRRLINKADKQGAREIAPRSFAVAEKKLAETDAFITQNPYKKEKMQELATEALFWARRLHEIAR